jgi:transposase-like protein
MDAKQGEPAGSQNPQGVDQIKAISWRRRERALKVHEMFEGGAKVREIAQFFGISRRMVFKDLKAAKRLHKEAVETVDQGELLGGEIAFWRQVVRQAMRDYQMAQSENGKIGFLRVASEARAKLQKLYQDTGLITTVPTRISLEEGNPFTDPEFRKEYVALLKKAREKGIPIFGL